MDAPAPDLDALISFANRHPFPPAWPADTIRRFLTSLISSPALIIDLAVNEQRVAVAVLIDRIQNSGNNANLEILGLDVDGDPWDILGRVIETARLRLPADKAGFQLELPSEMNVPAAWLAGHALRDYYRSFDLILRDLPIPGFTQDPAIRPAELSDYPTIYSVMRESFRENPDTSVPPAEEWLAHYRTAPSTFLIHCTDGAVDGYISFQRRAGDGEGEIGTLGVLPAARGQGFGRALLSAALAILARQGIRACRLTVAAQNESALRLYESLGFTIMQGQRVFVCRTRSDTRTDSYRGTLEF